LWRNAVLASQPLAGADRRKVVPFIKTVFGEPGAALPDEHVSGWIAEFLWYRLAQEMSSRPGGTLQDIHGPGFHATEPGGDGLTVWRREDSGVLTFCLWEIKNHVGTSTLSKTVGRAYAQLHERAEEYLAKLTGISAASGDESDVAELYGDLVNLWVDGSDRAGAGVAVGTHSYLAPHRCFSTMHNHFPALQGEWQLEGLIAAVARFDQFAAMVKEQVWKAL
jgi:hypothetical protein